MVATMDLVLMYLGVLSLIYPIVIIVVGIILYVLLSNKSKPTLLGLAFIVYGILDIIARLIFMLPAMSTIPAPHPGVELIVMANIVSSIIRIIALTIFAALVIIGVNKILESEAKVLPPQPS